MAHMIDAGSSSWGTWVPFLSTIRQSALATSIDDGAGQLVARHLSDTTASDVLCSASFVQTARARACAFSGALPISSLA
eukprot:5105963-Pyramimonas_sp.AAC.1